MTVAQLEHRMSNMELVEWIALYTIEAQDREAEAKRHR